MGQGVTGRDQQMISELVDGKLRGARRDEALRRIESDEALYEVFVEAARYREVDGRRRDRARRWRGPMVALFGLPLIMALALVVAWVGSRSADPLTSAALVRELVTQPRMAVVLARNDWFVPRWPDPPAAGAVAPPADPAFRAGALTLDLELALRQRQPRAAASVARRLAVELATTVGGAAGGYSELAAALDGPPSSADWRGLRRRAATLAERTVASPGFDARRLTFGRWCEAGRLAADSGNQRLLTSDGFRALLPGLVERDDWDPAVATELERLTDLLRPELNELQVAAIGVGFEAILARG